MPYFDVAHFDLLLLKGIAYLGLAMVERTINLLPLALDLLTDAVILALLLAQFRVLIVAFLLQLGRVVSVQFAQFLGPGAKDLEWISQLGDEGTGELFVFGCAGFEGA